MADDEGGLLAEGTMVAGYRVARRIGHGGMGDVYAAEEPTIKKRVAVKVLRHALAQDPASEARFQREAQAANGVRHPAIVDVFAFGKLADGRPYFVMSLLDGRSLRDELIARGTIPPAEAWAWLREVADALSVAHAAGLIHRDVKPDNIFIERFGNRPAKPRLLDLGLVKWTRAPATEEEAQPGHLTRSGVPMGSPTYMAPEQWWGTDVTPQSDQYALGVTLFEMLAGRPPFVAERYMEIAQAHLHTEPPSLVELGCEVPAAVEPFVKRLLAKTATDRFPSMSELVAAGDAAFASAPSVKPPALAVSLTPDQLKQSPSGQAAGFAQDPTHALGPTEPAPLGGALAPSNPPSLPRTVTEPLVGAFGAADERAMVAAAASAPTAVDPQRFVRTVRLELALLLLVPAALYGIGYVGSYRRDLKQWVMQSGWAIFPILFAIVGGLVAVGLATRARAKHGTRSLVPWVVAAITAALGAFGTYTGWRATMGGVETMSEPEKFDILHIGLYEADTCRFIGFFFASFLFVLIAASAGASVGAGAGAAPGIRKGEAAIVATTLAVLTVACSFVAPSAAIAAGAGTLVVAIDLMLPIAEGLHAARDEIERAAAGAVAVLLAVGAAITRTEVREAAVWGGKELFGSDVTRAVRVVELGATEIERLLTWLVGLGAVGAVVVLAGLRLRRSLDPEQRRLALRPTGRVIALAAFFVALLVSDIVQRSRFSETRDQLHTQLEPQFALFARLNPPEAGRCDMRQDNKVHSAAGLQIARNVVAVNARPVAPLSAALSPEGALNFGRDLSHALAEHHANDVGAETDLLVAIDREVRWGDVVRLLDVARTSGARHIEVLLTRGGPFVLPKGAPPEASWVIASDFCAYRAELGEDGFRAEPGASFGVVAPDLVKSLGNGTTPVKTIATR